MECEAMKPRKPLLLVVALLFVLPAAACVAPFLPPPANTQERDIVGIWETDCGKHCAERIVLRSDGTFQQMYSNPTVEDFVPETTSNRWWLEHLADGRVRLHLKGGRYYREGIEFAKLGGRELPAPAEFPDFWGKEGPPPFTFYDPIAREHLQMLDELVLNVRSTRSGELLLLHMWTSSDRGFAVFGANAEVFHQAAEDEKATEATGSR